MGRPTSFVCLSGTDYKHVWHASAHTCTSVHWVSPVPIRFPFLCTLTLATQATATKKSLLSRLRKIFSAPGTCILGLYVRATQIVSRNSQCLDSHCLSTLAGPQRKAAAKEGVRSTPNTAPQEISTPLSKQQNGLKQRKQQQRQRKQQLQQQRSPYDYQVNAQLLLNESLCDRGVLRAIAASRTQCNNRHCCPMSTEHLHTQLPSYSQSLTHERLCRVSRQEGTAQPKTSS